MKATKIEQRDDGGIKVRINQLMISPALGKILPSTSQSASNYLSARMVEEGLIPADLASRAFAGRCSIDCATAQEAEQIAARVDQAVNDVAAKLAADRAVRVMEYVAAIVRSGKQLYTRGSNGRFEKIG
jgi:hypothetical protein